MGYNFTAHWLKGAKNQVADALSCHPCCKPTDLAEFDLLNASISQIRASNEDTWGSENMDLKELRKHAADDPEYQTLKELVMTEFPNDNKTLWLNHIPSTGPKTSGTVPNLGPLKLSRKGFRLYCGLSQIPGNS
jgi:hypothetical protein